MGKRPRSEQKAVQSAMVTGPLVSTLMTGYDQEVHRGSHTERFGADVHRPRIVYC